MKNGKGAVTALLKDTALLNRLNASLDNIQKGTDAFSQDMEALSRRQHTFLRRSLQSFAAAAGRSCRTKYFSRSGRRSF